MRLVIRLVLALAVLAMLAVGAFALLLPRLVGSDAAREWIGTTAREATGRDVSWAKIDVGVLPPRLLVTQARVAGAAPAAKAMLEGADVELRLALLPLLARAVVVDSLQVEGATLRLVRTAEGLQLPEPAGKDEPGAGRAAPRAADEEGRQEAAPGFALAVRHVALRRVRVVLEDRAVAPTVTWDLRELDATLRGTSLEAPIDLHATGTLASGGSFALEGRAQQQGPIEVKVTLDGLVLDPVQPYLAQGQRALGRLSGSVTAKGTLPDPDSIRLDLRLQDGDVAFEDMSARGALTLRADLQGGLSRTRGSYSVDATDAELVMGSFFEKPRGEVGSLEGRLVSGPDGKVGVEENRLRIKNLDAKLSVKSGTRTRATLQAEPFSMSGWEALLPALRDSPPSGRIGLDGVQVTTAPLELRGSITLEEVLLKRPQAADLLLSGALVGEGSTLRGRDLVATVGGQKLPIELEVTQLGADVPQARLGARLEDADTNALLTALAGKPDTVSGPLDLNASLRAPLGGTASLTDALKGELRLEITPGRIQGVSLLKSSFERLGSLGETAILLGGLRGGSTLQRFYADDFKTLRGTFEAADGFVRTDDLQIVYRNYTVDLTGRVKLADMGLQLAGRLTIDEEVDALLAGADPAAAGEPAPQGRKRVIPLAEIGGTLDKPRVVITSQAALQFASLYALGGRRSEKVDKVERKIDEVLGEGTGKQVRDALEGILGGRKKP